MTSRNQEKIHVAVRCRPMTEWERSHRSKRVVDCLNSGTEVSVVTTTGGLGLTASQLTKTYLYDKVFSPNATQLEVYNSVVAGQLQDVLAGYNCTVLAYGQTGTGKTFTMEGERTMDKDYSWDTDPRAGIIPRALSQLFDHLESSGSEFSVRVSLLEIYNEEIYDLLSPSSGMAKMKIYDDSTKKGSVVVSGLTEVLVQHKSDVYDILQQGAAKRRTAATNLNEFSSRSHSVFSVTVHSKDITKNQMEEEELIKIGKLNLVDLAGSENIGRSGASDKRAREAGNINTSLLTLGRCITALVDRAPHVPYRESKLTRLLQDSLGGCTKTSIIATISPGSDNLEETLSTLEYAYRAKNIHNRPKVNQKLTKRALIKEYDEEIRRLQREILATREKNGIYLDPKQYQEMQNKIEELTATLQQRCEEVEKYKDLFTESSKELNAIQEALQTTKGLLMQQKFLTKAHLEHGSEVTAQANELLATANIVTDDIVKVHDKVNRVEVANNTNLTLAGSVKERVNEDISLLQNGTKSILQQTVSCMGKMVTDLDAMTERDGERCRNVNSQILMCKNFMLEVYKDNSRSRELTLELLNDLSENFDSTQLNHKDKLMSHLNSVSTKMEMFLTVSSNIEKVVKQIQTSTDVQRQEIQKKADILKCHVEMIENVVENTEQQFDEMLSSSKAKVESMQAKLEEMCDFHKKSLDLMFSDFHKHREDTISGVRQLVESGHSVLSNTEKSSDVQTKHIDMLDEMAVTELEICAKSLTSTHQEIETDNQTTSEIADKLLDDTNILFKQSEMQTKSLLDSSNQAMNACSKQSIQLEQKCESSINCILESHQTQKELVEHTVEDVNCKLAVVEEAITGASNSITNEMEEYCSNKLVRVVPTGETPARKDYKYTRKVNPLPMEDELIKRFEDRLEAGDLESSEEEEEEEEELDDLESAESSSVKSVESGGIDLDQSITIPNIGGAPFFTNRLKNGKNSARTTNKTTRLPLRSTHNTMK